MNRKRKYGKHPGSSERQHRNPGRDDGIAEDRPDGREIRHRSRRMDIGKCCPGDPCVIAQDIERRGHELTHLVPEVGKVQNRRMR